MAKPGGLAAAIFEIAKDVEKGAIRAKDISPETKASASIVEAIGAVAERGLRKIKEQDADDATPAKGLIDKLRKRYREDRRLYVRNREADANQGLMSAVAVQNVMQASQREKEIAQTKAAGATDAEALAAVDQKTPPSSVKQAGAAAEAYGTAKGKERIEAENYAAMGLPPEAVTEIKRERLEQQRKLAGAEVKLAEQSPDLERRKVEATEKNADANMISARASEASASAAGSKGDPVIARKYAERQMLLDGTSPDAAVSANRGEEIALRSLGVDKVTHRSATSGAWKALGAKYGMRSELFMNMDPESLETGAAIQAEARRLGLDPGEIEREFRTAYLTTGLNVRSVDDYAGLLAFQFMHGKAGPNDFAEAIRYLSGTSLLPKGAVVTPQMVTAYQPVFEHAGQMLLSAVRSKEKWPDTPTEPLGPNLQAAKNDITTVFMNIATMAQGASLNDERNPKDKPKIPAFRGSR